MARRCSDHGIVPLAAKARTSGNHAAGLYEKSDFVYREAGDAYRCPAGERAIDRMTDVENGLTLHQRWSLAQGNTTGTVRIRPSAGATPTCD